MGARRQKITNLDYERDIGPIAQSQMREVRVSVQKFKGRLVPNIRRWTEPYDGDSWIPTKQGIAFSIEHLSDLIAALREAEDHARANGLIDDAPATEAAE